jgi:hypothetical protein
MIMEQRALLASALVLGCVTAAGAGGYMASRQNGPASADNTSQAAAEGIATPAEGTVAEIDTPSAAEEVPAASVTPATAAGTGGNEPPARPQAAVVPQAPRPTTAPPARSTSPRASSASSAPPADAPVAPARPSATPTVARSTPAAPARPPVQASPSSSTASASNGSGDNWPSRDYGSNGRDAGGGSAGRDAEATSAGADNPLPSRGPINEPAAPATPVRRLETVTIPADAVIGVQLESSISSDKAKVEDTVRARVTRDLMAGGQVVVPSGSRLLGTVTLVEQGGRLKERARLGIRFQTLVLSDGSEVKLPTETIYREGESPAGRSAAKIGGATIGGAILGAIVGGGKGAAIGAATGAGSGTGWAMAGDRQPAELRSGTSLTVRVSDSVSTQIER